MATRRVTKDPQVRRQELLDISEALFLNKGYESTTINDILGQAEIAKGTFYHYFSSKEQIMEAVVDRYVEQGKVQAQQIADDPSLSATKKFARVILSLGSQSDTKSQVIDLLHQRSNAHMHQRSIVESVKALSPILAGIVEEGITQGVFTTDYPQETVEFLLTTAQFVFDGPAFNWSEEELVPRIQAYVQLLQRSLGAKPGTFDFMFDILS